MRRDPEVEALRERIVELEEDLEGLRTRHTLTRLDDARAVGAIFDHAREALEAAYTELERAEEHHRWHHEQEGHEVEDDEERLRVLMVIAEALEELPEPLSDDAEDQIAELREKAVNLRDAVRSIPGPISPDDLEAIAGRALQSFGDSTT